MFNDVYIDNAVMVVCLSKFNPNNEKQGEGEDYKFNYGGQEFSYKGKQTNDAPTRCLIDCAKSEGIRINKILCIVTKEVFTIPIDDNKPAHTAYDRYVELVKKIDNNIEVIPIYNGFSYVNGNVCDINDVVNEKALIVYKRIVEELIDTNYNISFSYIDYTGGLRDMSFLMTSIIRYMEFYGIKLRQIVYSDYFRSTKELVSINYIYDMYTLIDGVSEFVSTGNAIQLKKIYDEKMCIEDNNDIAGRIKNVIDSLIGFSNTISLCAVGKISDALQNIKRKVEELEQVQDCINIYEQIFITLIKLIKDKLDFCFDENYSYPKLIRWCVENGMIQQAVTIYIEKMPEYYFKNELIPNELVRLVEINVCSSNDTSTEYSKAFYTELYSKLMPNTQEKSDCNTEFSKIINIILECADTKKAKTVLKNGHMEEYRKEIIKGIKDKIDELENDNLKNALRNINKEIFGRYANGKRLDSSLPKDTERMINSVRNNNKASFAILHRIAFGSEMTETTGLGAEKRTYSNKIKAIKNLDENNICQLDENDKKHLVRIMQYYIAIKIVRNRMNHASEKDEEQDEGIAIEYLKNERIYTFESNIVSALNDMEFIRNLLLGAVDLN